MALPIPTSIVEFATRKFTEPVVSLTIKEDGNEDEPPLDLME
jgi:hypothetical protein